MTKLFPKLFLTAILFFLFPTVSFARVVINEVAWMGTSEHANCEWLELYNNGESRFDLSGWILYEQGGNVKIIDLSKSIGAGEYFLIERLVPSCPDAVPGINDVSGSFGGSGLINSPGGEFLVLKDASGNTIQTLDFSDGWPAGDNITKETMQWTGSSWITASPTPGAVNNTTSNISDNSNSSGEVLGASSSSSSSSSSQSSGGSATNVSSLNSQLEIIAGNDRTTSPGSPIWFQAMVKKNTASASLELNWSFGDGNVGVGPLVSHTYKYPGDYVVVLSARAGDMFSVSRLKVKIIESNISVSDKNEYLEISNNGNTEVNLFNWKVEDDGKGFVFQPNTIILPHSSIKLDKSLLKMKGYDNSLGTSLKNGLREEVFSVAPVEKVDLSEVSKNLDNIKKEFSVIQEKAENLGLIPQNKNFNIQSASLTNLPLASTTIGDVIYEAPKAESFFRRTWKFITGLFN
ncbi:MAG: lamin tail domain-containing protein [Bacteroidota bacterium]